MRIIFVASMLILSIMIAHVCGALGKGSLCDACGTGNPAALSQQLRERCARGYPLAFTKMQSVPWWPQDPRYPNWDYYFNNKRPRPDMGYGITPK